MIDARNDVGQSSPPLKSGVMPSNICRLRYLCCLRWCCDVQQNASADMLDSPQDWPGVNGLTWNIRAAFRSGCFIDCAIIRRKVSELDVPAV